MRISVRVKLHAEEEALRELYARDGMRVFEAKLRAKPEKGEANLALATLVADHFRIRKDQVRVVAGLTARHKIVQLG